MDNQQNQTGIQFPMKWYAFLVFFWLIFNAGIGLFNAFSYFTGNHIITGVQTALELYPSNSGLKFLDMITGLLSIMLSVFIIYVRSMLVGFKKQAPDLIVSMYVVSAILNVFYPAALYVMTGITPTVQVIALVVIGQLFMALANFVYFKKRKSLFVN